MKKILMTALTIIIATTVLALPPPTVGNGPGSSHGGGPGKIALRKDWNEPRIGGVSKSPNHAMANAVAISGFTAIGARLVQEIFTPPQDLILVVPEGTTTPIIIKEQEPVVTHPVPISPLPIEVIKSK